MGDHQQTALVGAQELAQPHHGVVVQVVGGLVQEHGVRVREQDPCELHAPALTARERVQRLLQHARREVEVVGDGGGLGLRRVAAAGQELGLQAVVAAHGLGPDGVVLRGHLLLGAPQLGDHPGEVARGEDAVPRQLVHVVHLGVLRQVADGTRACDLTRGGQGEPGQHLGHGGLPGAVAAHQTHLVALVHAEVHLVHEQTRSGAQFEVGHGDQRSKAFRGTVPRAHARWRGRTVRGPEELRACGRPVGAGNRTSLSARANRGLGRSPGTSN